MSYGIRVAAMLVAASIPLTPVRAQGLPSGIIGWYNGDWQQAIASLSNQHVSDRQFTHLFDDFVVPADGWVVSGVFAHLSMRVPDVKQAYWEIRSGISQGGAGALVASGLNAATMTRTGTTGGAQDIYLI